MVRQQTRKKINRFKIEEKKAFTFRAIDTKNGSGYNLKSEPGRGYMCQCQKQLKSPGKGMCEHKRALYKFLSDAGIAPLCETQSST
jgi:hypothetical protein